MVRASAIKSMPEVSHSYLPILVMYAEPKKPLDRSTSPNIRAVSGDSIVLQLFFSCEQFGPPSGKDCRLRRRPASRRRVDAPPVEGLVVTAVRFVLKTT